MTGFAARLKELREGVGMTVAVLAARTGLSRAMLYNYEQGSALPGWTAALAISKALGTYLDVLAQESGAPPERRADGLDGREPSPDHPEWFGARLEELRSAAGLTRRDLHERTGITLTQVYEMEAGRMLPGWEIARRLADTLGVSLDAFCLAPTTVRPPQARRGRPRKTVTTVTP